jgi:hypothetical protein
MDHQERLLPLLQLQGKVATEDNFNGIYTKRLLENIRIPGMQIESISKK